MGKINTIRALSRAFLCTTKSRGIGNYSLTSNISIDIDMIIFYPNSLWRFISNWRLKPWEQPIDEMRSYFGEKVTMYFDFNGHVAGWLRHLSYVGFLVGISWAIELGYYNSIDTAFSAAYATPFYCVFVSFWSQFMIEYWKRRQNRCVSLSLFLLCLLLLQRFYFCSSSSGWPWSGE
jgi:hypothetical protein